MPKAGFVSCDIVGHSAVKDLSVQRHRLKGMNVLIREVLEQSGPAHAVWASGGDGGHVVFTHTDWPASAVQCLIKLRQWAHEEGVGLRVIGHCGDIDQIEGADGRVQLVGDGINLAGRLLARAFPQGVLVTTPFKEALEHASVPGLVLHDPRVLRVKYFSPQIVYLLSVLERFQSHWDTPARGDRELLEQALTDGRAWQAIYLAKRLLQTNSIDEQAEEALDQLSPHQLVYRQQAVTADGTVQERWVLNPFLGALDPPTRRQFIQAAQLVERRRGEVLCRVGEGGDTMFIVLEGVVGAFPPDPKSGGIDLNPRVVFGPGEIVGELAFTLHRPRTAALLAVEDVSLLAIQATELEVQARTNPRSAASLEKFLTGRTLEYACNSIPYLIGRDETGPLVDIGRKKAWDRLLPHAEKIVCPLADPRPLTLQDPRFAGDGIYVLVSGSLRSLAHPDKLLSCTDLPLVYSDLPGWVVSPNHHYRPEGSDAILLRIAKEAFLGRRPVIDSVVACLMHELPRLYHFDVFISYTFDDRAQAQQWRDALDAAGLRVYMEISTSGRYFRDRIEAGILDSLTLLVLVSANTMVRPMEHNWVRQEIAFRQAAFETTTARILPVRLKGGNPETLADGYTIIESVGREEAAITAVIETVRSLRQGQRTPPFALARKADVRLGG
jgi:CRP-like cAMP-binding protein